MAIRIMRGLFRLWIVLSVLWIGCVGAITWGQYVYYEPLFKASGDHSSLTSTFVICEKAKTDKECFDLLTAAGKNPCVPVPAVPLYLNLMFVGRLLR